MAVSDVTRFAQGVDRWTAWLASSEKAFLDAGEEPGPARAAWIEWREANRDIDDLVRDTAQAAFMRGFDKCGAARK